MRLRKTDGQRQRLTDRLTQIERQRRIDRHRDGDRQTETKDTLTDRILGIDR